MSTSSVESAPSSQSNRPRIYERLTKSALRDALYKMQLIRRFEESAEDAYVRGQSYGTMHLSIGEEATAVGACAPLSDSDYITSTHRGHGHCIAKGAEVKRMFAEFLGRETGYCRGRGGSMHIADPSKGNLGANGIVGGGIPIAVGAALSVKMRKTGAVVVCFFGDGANNEGAFHESLEHGVDLETAGGVRVREQQLWHVDVDRAFDRGQADRRARRGLFDAGRDRRRQQFRRGR